jgi:hypothetical protein
MARILLVALCVTVVLQLLGIPFTLMDAVSGFDDGGSVTAEEFTILTSLSLPHGVSPSHARMERNNAGEPFDLARLVFHPPPSLR